MIGLSPLPSAHPKTFQRLPVRPSTLCYQRLSLAKGRSPGFASTAADCAPCSDSLSLRLPALRRLTLPATVTRRLIMQKARRHWTARQPAPPACRRMVSSSVSPRYSRCFSPFPHGTRPLSVSQEYLALADGAACFRGDSSGPPLLRILTQTANPTPTGLSPPAVRLPRRFGLHCCPLGQSYNPGRALTRPVWAVPRSLAATCGITLVFFSWGYLDVSVPPVRLPS